jgi:hypothetical protein
VCAGQTYNRRFFCGSKYPILVGGGIFPIVELKVQDEVRIKIWAAVRHSVIFMQPGWFIEDEREIRTFFNEKG